MDLHSFVVETSLLDKCYGEPVVGWVAFAAHIMHKKFYYIYNFVIKKNTINHIILWL